MYENDEIEIDLSRVFEIIKKHFKPFALIILAASIVAALITLFLIPKKYTAEAKLIIVQKSNPDSQQISYNDLQTSQKLVNTYSEILKSEDVYKRQVVFLKTLLRIAASVEADIQIDFDLLALIEGGQGYRRRAFGNILPISI